MPLGDKVDVEKLKNQEGIERVNEAKIYSHELYWIMRRRPVQIIKQVKSGNELFINEKICLALILPKMNEEVGGGVDFGKEPFSDLVNLLYYNLKYREYTQHSLELMVESFFVASNIQ